MKSDGDVKHSKKKKCASRSVIVDLILKYRNLIDRIKPHDPV